MQTSRVQCTLHNISKSQPKEEFSFWVLEKLCEVHYLRTIMKGIQSIINPLFCFLVYKSPEYEQLAYDLTVERLVTIGYPQVFYGYYNIYTCTMLIGT